MASLGLRDSVNIPINAVCEMTMRTIGPKCTNSRNLASDISSTRDRNTHGQVPHPVGM